MLVHNFIHLNLFQHGEFLNINFVALDVELENYAELPDVLLHPQNFKLVRRFIRQWNRFVQKCLHCTKHI